MRTRHLSVSITSYGDGTYALAYVMRTYAQGRPVGRKVIARREADRRSVLNVAAAALEAMVEEEDQRQRQLQVGEYQMSDGAVQQTLG